mgnify:CR=1 FL=1
MSKPKRKGMIPPSGFVINRRKSFGTGACEEQGIPNSNKSKSTNRQKPKRRKR